MKKAKLVSALLIGLLGLSGLFFGSATAFAHDEATLDKMKAPHGGQLRMAGIYHFEFVVVKDSKDAKDNPVLVYVTDHAGQKIPTAGATGTATILAGKTKVVANLVADGDNHLKGSANYASTPDLKAILSITLAGKPAEQARFTPLAKVKDEHLDHKN